MRCKVNSKITSESADETSREPGQLALPLFALPCMSCRWVQATSKRERKKSGWSCASGARWGKPVYEQNNDSMRRPYQTPQRSRQARQTQRQGSKRRTYTVLIVPIHKVRSTKPNSEGENNTPPPPPTAVSAVACCARVSVEGCMWPGRVVDGRVVWCGVVWLESTEKDN